MTRVLVAYGSKRGGTAEIAGGDYRDRTRIQAWAAAIADALKTE